MRCNNCGLTIPLDKAPNLKECTICANQVLETDARDILEFGKHEIAREVRPTQVALARDVESIMRMEKGTLLAEGGTGIGKSFAYLIPAILESDKRVVISTAKKTLQDQLANKDIPLLLQKMGRTKSYGVYKGNSNYACRLLEKEVPPTGKRAFKEFIAKAVKAKEPADVANWDGAVPSWWSKVSADNCMLGAKCPHRNTCRPSPREYDIIITNHHLTAIDLKHSPGTLFDPYDVLIMDEAHQAPEAFRSAHSMSVTKRGLGILLGMLDADTHLRGAIDDSGVTTAVRLGGRIRDVKSTYTVLHRVAAGKGRTGGAFNAQDCLPQIDALSEATTAVSEALFKLKQEFQRSFDFLRTNDDPGADEMLGMLTRLDRISKRATTVGAFAESLREDTKTGDFIATGNEKGLFLQPLNIGKMVGPKLQAVKHKVLISATLSLGNDFSYTKKHFGLDEPGREKYTKESIYKSPFKLEKQAVVYLPKHVPIPVRKGQPGREVWVKGLTTEIAQLVGATRGDAFVLFSARADMEEVLADLGSAFWKNMGLNLILHEGEATATLNAFKNTPKSVLFGLKSFWEGVDVAGDKLKLVIIPKLPFPNPTDALIAAQSDAVEQQGGSAFWEVMIPQMIFDMKQGCGRLIRTQRDRGFIAILDSRIWTGTSQPRTHEQRLAQIKLDPKQRRMGYGAKALDALGFTQLTDNFDIVKAMHRKFFE